MSKEKQIDEMARIIDDNHGFIVSSVETAESIYNVGYRKHEWISVEERFPERAGNYICCTSAGKVIMCNYLDYWSRGNRWEHRDITHWMPVPEPPKMRKEDEGK